MIYDLINKARMVADKAHRDVGQVRKGSGAPYITHCEGVARLVTSASGTQSMIEAAYLHDTLEDTDLTGEEIKATFGPLTLDLVKAVTSVSKPEDGTRAARKAIDLNHYAAGDSRAQTIKLADIVDNLSDISTLDPGFARVYLQEKYELAQALTKGHRDLHQRALELCLKHMEALQVSVPQ